MFCFNRSDNINRLLWLLPFDGEAKYLIYLCHLRLHREYKSQTVLHTKHFTEWFEWLWIAILILTKNLIDVYHDKTSVPIVSGSVSVSVAIYTETKSKYMKDKTHF